MCAVEAGGYSFAVIVATVEQTPVYMHNQSPGQHNVLYMVHMLDDIAIYASICQGTRLLYV